MTDFSGKTAVVTGATGGIGRAVVKELAEHGAFVVLLGRDTGRLEKTAAELELDPGRARCFAVDISSEDSVRETVKKIVGESGRIDILVNAAGTPGPSALCENYPEEDFRAVYEANVFGTYRMMKEVLPVMRAQKSGAVLNFGSVSGICAYPYESGYGSSKSAVIQLTRGAAAENGANGVRINVISPGWVDTPMMKQVVDSYRDVGFEDTGDNVNFGPMERPAAPEEIARAAAFLCSDEASYINGANLAVDGGMSLY